MILKSQTLKSTFLVSTIIRQNFDSGISTAARQYRPTLVQLIAFPYHRVDLRVIWQAVPTHGLSRVMTCAAYPLPYTMMRASRLARGRP